MNEHVWDTVGRLVDWIDRNTSLPPDTGRLLRVLKLSEEVGETSQALAGVLGTNLRGEVTHTWRDVENELCDVILTALVALATINPGAGVDAAVWPDDTDALPDVEQLLRELTEQVGRVAQSVAGALGSNPRKGQTNTWDDVQERLRELVLTAMIALTAVNPAARDVFAERLELVTARSLGAGLLR